MIRSQLLLMLSLLTLTACVQQYVEPGMTSPAHANDREQYLATPRHVDFDKRTAIRNGERRVGMDEAQMLVAWGPSTHCNRVLSVTPERKVCVYVRTERHQMLDRRYYTSSARSVL